MFNSKVNFWRRDSRSSSHTVQQTVRVRRSNLFLRLQQKNLCRESLQRSRQRAMSICYRSKWLQIAQLEEEKPKNALASSLSRMNPITIIFSTWSYMHYHKLFLLLWVCNQSLYLCFNGS